MMLAAKTFITALLSLAVLDGLMLTFVLLPFYQGKLAHLLSGKVTWSAAVLFYLCFTAGFTYLILLPATQQQWGLGKTALTCAVFGAVCYATYDLTNQATLKDWPWAVTVVDIAWGATLCAAIGLITRFVLKA